MAPNKFDYELPVHPVDYGVDLKIDQVKIDPEAQRTLNEKRAQGIADNMVREAIGSIVVSRRPNGDHYIVDGQHRWRACQLSGYDTIKAEVHQGLDQEHEAILFLIKNRESHKPSALDEYRVGLTGGVKLFTQTESVIVKHNLSISGSTSANTVGAVAGVLRIVSTYGAETLDRTLTIAEDAWGRVGGMCWDGMLLGGIGMFLGRHPSVQDDKDLARRLERFGTADRWRSAVLSRSSNGGFNNSGTGSRLSSCYQLIVLEWNKNRRKNRIEI